MPTVSRGVVSADDLSMIKRRNTVADLRKRRWSWSRIAEECGVSVATVRSDYKLAIEMADWTTAETANAIRHDIIESGYDLIASIYDLALDGDIKTIETVLKINAQLLDATAPKITQLDVTSAGRPIAPISSIEVVLTAMPGVDLPSHIRRVTPEELDGGDDVTTD